MTKEDLIGNISCAMAQLENEMSLIQRTVMSCFELHVFRSLLPSWLDTKHSQSFQKSPSNMSNLGWLFC